MEKPSVGMIGLAVMGSNLVRNIERRGYPCAVYNRSYEVTEKFIVAQNGKRFSPAKTLEEFVSILKPPRQIFIMVKAGTPTDEVIEKLIPLVSKGDIIIDGGNAYFEDTVRREKRCREAGISFLGVGISGGEEGALNGPSLMPGGPKDAWKMVAPLLEKIAAYADGPCTAYIGPDGSGHFVKMVHNGIEYGDMQLIAEAYDALRNALGSKPEELSRIFEEWNKGVLSSYLIEITGKIFTKRDDLGEGFLVDKVLDRAGQKGTGKWTAQVALDLGIAIPSISAAVDARVLSAMKEERTRAAQLFLAHRTNDYSGDRQSFIAAVHDALYCSKVMCYAQGMALLRAASLQWNWNMKLHEIAALWKGGCIIRARFLDEIRQAFQREPSLPNLLVDPVIRGQLTERINGLREVVQVAAEGGIPVPAFSSSLSYYDCYRSENLPHNLTQAQRDFFGAHTYERKDREGTFHTDW